MHSSPVEALTQLRLEAIKLNVLFLELQGDIMRPLVDTNIKCLFEYSSNYKMLSQEMNQLVSSIESMLTDYKRDIKTCLIILDEEDQDK